MDGIKEKLYPLKFVPQLQYRLWGGETLSKKWGKDVKDFPVGESWEISAVNEHVSVVQNGNLKGIGLDELISRYGEYLLGKKYDSFPLLIKFLDAEKPLSVQVHPNDYWANKRHNCAGKSEMWYVLDAKEGAKNIIGFKPEITQETFDTALKEGKVAETLQEIPVEKGDVFYLPAGRVHAIGEGIVIAEIQQSSDVTYRIYDYDRTDKDGRKRELHTDLAKDVIDFSPIKEIKNPNYPGNTIVDCPYFTTEKYDMQTKAHSFTTNLTNFNLVICTDGEGTLKFGTEEIAISKGDSLLIPAILGAYSVAQVAFLRVIA